MYMGVVFRIKEMIADLDSGVRHELTAAAAEGRFDDLADLAPIAKDISVLAARWIPDSEKTPSDADAPLVQEACDAIPESPEHPEVRRSRLKLKKADYPQFLREKEDLVKLGWSPRGKGPYEHRVPKIGVNAVVSAVAVRGKAGHRFSMDEIIKGLSGTESSEQVPSYQIYAVVSWLKWAGMMLQHGRQGYTIVRPQTFASSIETAWQSLPQR